MPGLDAKYVNVSNEPFHVLTKHIHSDICCHQLDHFWDQLSPSDAGRQKFETNAMWVDITIVYVDSASLIHNIKWYGWCGVFFLHSALLLSFRCNIFYKL